MWQYTEEGRVDGINAYVDLNISYFNYVDSEEDIIANPRYKTVRDDDMTLVNDEVEVMKKTIVRSTPTASLPNKFGSISKGSVVRRTGYNDAFSRIDYNGRVVYISNNDIIIRE